MGSCSRSCSCRQWSCVAVHWAMNGRRLSHIAAITPTGLQAEACVVDCEATKPTLLKTPSSMMRFAFTNFCEDSCLQVFDYCNEHKLELKLVLDCSCPKHLQWSTPGCTISKDSVDLSQKKHVLVSSIQNTSHGLLSHDGSFLLRLISEQGC